MKYKLSEDNKINTIYLNGEIDMEVVDSIREIIFPLIDEQKEVHINMKDVQYMDVQIILYRLKRILKKMLQSLVRHLINLLSK